MRVHTGRRRNEAARRAILEAAAELLTRGTPVTIGVLAAEAGVGRQTIYRWWPSKGAVLLEAMSEYARRAAPRPDNGSLREDLAAFLTATFQAAGAEPNAAVLRTAMAEALHDEHAAGLLREFTADRREELRAVLEPWMPAADLDLAVDQAFGVLWYRLLLGHAPVDQPAARRLAGLLARQLESA